MSAILSFAGWSVVPNLASGFLHNGLCQVLPPSVIARPGTASYARDRRIIYIVVVLSYLLYTAYTAYVAIEPNYYNLLDVPLNVDDKQLRRAFRQVSSRHHPDKGGDEGIFRALRTAYDTLSNPSTRFAYDRFGAQVNGWDKLTELSDYMYRGFLGQLPFYVGSSIFILVLGYAQGSNAVYWRMLSFLTLAALNFTIVTRPARLSVLTYLLPNFVQYQQTSLFQSLCVTLLVAISQIGPVLFPLPQDSTSVMETAALAHICQTEATQALQLTHLPFQRGNTKTNDLYSKTAEWMIQARIDQDPEVVAARAQIMQTRQAG